jgi:hypothetical protein
MYVEAECDESRGMGTEAHRETKRVTGMGCRTSAAGKPIPNRPFRGLGAKDLTAWVSSPASSQAPDLRIFIFPPLDLCYNNSNVHDNLQISRTRGPRHILNRHASRFACVNPRTERTPPRRGANIEPFEFQRLRDHASIDKLVRYARIPLIAPLVYFFSCISFF